MDYAQGQQTARAYAPEPQAAVSNAPLISALTDAMREAQARISQLSAQVEQIADNLFGSQPSQIGTAMNGIGKEAVVTPRGAEAQRAARELHDLISRLSSQIARLEAL